MGCAAALELIERFDWDAKPGQLEALRAGTADHKTIDWFTNRKLKYMTKLECLLLEGKPVPNYLRKGNFLPKAKRHLLAGARWLEPKPCPRKRKSEEPQAPPTEQEVRAQLEQMGVEPIGQPPIDFGSPIGSPIGFASPGYSPVGSPIGSPAGSPAPTQPSSPVSPIRSQIDWGDLEAAQRSLEGAEDLERAYAEYQVENAQWLAEQEDPVTGFPTDPTDPAAGFEFSPLMLPTQPTEAPTEAPKPSRKRKTAPTQPTSPVARRTRSSMKH